MKHCDRACVLRATGVKFYTTLLVLVVAFGGSISFRDHKKLRCAYPVHLLAHWRQACYRRNQWDGTNADMDN